MWFTKVDGRVVVGEMCGWQIGDRKCPVGKLPVGFVYFVLRSQCHSASTVSNRQLPDFIDSCLCIWYDLTSILLPNLFPFF